MGFSSACNTEEDRGVVLAAADRSSIMPGTSISYTVLNHSFKEISIPNCCFQPVVYVQRLNGSGWAESFAIGDPCLLKCATRLMLIPHGSGYGDSVRVDTLGRYRLRIEYGTGSNAPTGHTVYTNPFDVAFGLD